MNALILRNVIIREVGTVVCVVSVPGVHGVFHVNRKSAYIVVSHLSLCLNH